MKLELFHLNDQQTTSNSVLENIAGTSAVLNALRAQDISEDISIFLASGDTYIPGNFQEASRSLYGARSLGEIEIQNQMGGRQLRLVITNLIPQLSRTASLS
jgi:hypothetical protein